MISASANTSQAIASLRAKESSFLLGVREVLQAAVSATENSAKSTSLFRDRTGETRGSIVGSVSEFNGKVVLGGVSRWLNDGIRAHRIEARNGSVLRFVSNGEVIYRRWVNHPGTAPRPFATIARDAGIESIQTSGISVLRAALG